MDVKVRDGVKVNVGDFDMRQLETDILFHEGAIAGVESRSQSEFYHRRMVKYLKELKKRLWDIPIVESDGEIVRSQRHEIARLCELLVSTKLQGQRYRDEIKILKEKNVALADVIADLKMDLKARE